MPEAALWGAGQGPHSHDMLARIDPRTYTRLPWQPNTARFASNLFVDGQPHPYCCRTNLLRVLAEARSHGYVFNVGMEPEFFLVTRAEDGTIRPWDPHGVDRLTKPCYDFRSMAPAMEFLQELTQSLNGLGWGVYQADHEDGNSQFEVNFNYSDALTTADRITFFKMASRADRPQIRCDCHAHAQAVRRPDGQRPARSLSLGRRQDRQERVSR